MLTPSLRILLFLVATTVTLGAQEPLVVIVHPESGLRQLSKEEVTNLFLGRTKRLSGTLIALPVEQAKPTEVWARFYRLLVNKDLAEVNAYWARLFFSGQAQPPHRAQSAQDVVDMVAANKGAVGFVEKSKADKRVRVVFTLEGSP